MSYKIAFKKSVFRDLKKLSKDDAERILDKIEHDLPEKADTFPLLTLKQDKAKGLNINTGKSKN